LIEVPPPPEPAPEVAEDDGAEAVLPGLPTPPTAPPVLDPELVGLNVEVWELEAADDKEVVWAAIEVPEFEERSLLEERLDTSDEVEDTLLAKVERDLVVVTSVLFAMKLENIGFMKEESVEVVLAPDRVEAIPCDQHILQLTKQKDSQVIVEFEFIWEGAGELWVLEDLAGVTVAVDEPVPDEDVLAAPGLEADEAGADEEKYDPVGLLNVVEPGLEGRGVDGGDERTAWEFEPDTLMDQGLP